MDFEVLDIESAKKLGSYNKIKKYVYSEINKITYDIRVNGINESNKKILEILEKIKEIIEK